MPLSSFQNVEKILLVKLKHIGDVLLATPCIRALHATFPQAEISALVNEGTEVILKNNPLLKEVIVFPRRSMKSSVFLRIGREISFARSIRNRKFDLVVDLTASDRGAWLAVLSGARYRLAPDPQGKGFFGKKAFFTHLSTPPASPNCHEVTKNLSVLEAFGISTPEPKMEMHYSKQDELAAQDALSKLGFGGRGSVPSSSIVQEADGAAPSTRQEFAVVHPTSRWMFKCWDDERFAHLIDWLQTNCQIPVIVTCGPDEKELARARRVLSFCQSKPANLLGTLTLSQWAALVHSARLFIGVDSAPMHIAAAQGITSLALFGPTGFENWKPWAVRNQVLVHDCPCSRDRNPHCDWSRTRACMDAISLEEAQKAVESLLHR